MQAQVQGHLIKIQSSFRDDLLGKVEVFKQDTEEFYKDYATVCILSDTSGEIFQRYFLIHMKSMLGENLILFHSLSLCIEEP